MFGRRLTLMATSPAAMADAKAAGDTMSTRAEGFVSGFLESNCGAPAIEPGDFDYSLESLKALDAFLARARQRASSEALAAGVNNLSVFGIRNAPVFLSFAGAYAGEVIRGQSQGALTWRSFESLAADGTHASELERAWNGKDVANEYMLAGVRQPATCAPVQKVVEFMRNRPEDSLYAFARIWREHV
jgi:hypothetical protein